MTEYNIFCRSKEYNSDTSFQQKRYRIFNKEISKEEYENIKIPKHNIEFDKDEDYSTRFQTGFKKMREGLSQTQHQEFLNLPYFDAFIFQKITGIDVYAVEQMTLAQICEDLGKRVEIVDFI